MVKQYIKVLILLSLVLLYGCGSSNEGTNESTQNGQTQGEQPQNQQDIQETTKEFYSIGETVNVEGMEITVTSVQFTEPAEYTETKNGKVLTTTVTVKNIDQQNGFVDNTEFVLAGTSGKQYESYYGYDDANMFTADLKEGNQIDGKLAYDVAEEAEYILYYEPLFTLNEDAEIKFKITSADIK